MGTEVAAWRIWTRGTRGSWLRQAMLAPRGSTATNKSALGPLPRLAEWAPSGRATFATRSRSHVKFSDKKRHVPVILLRDFDPLGRQGDEVHVSPGYMRNYLYGRKVAVYSTPDNKRNLAVDRSVSSAVLAKFRLAKLSGGYATFSCAE